jgi:predicted RNase H-like HicB family nuclease
VARTEKTPSATSLKVGDYVASNVQGFNWKGVVVRDHGPLGVGGRQIVTVRVENREVHRQFDVRADNVDRVPAERRFDIVMVAEPDGDYSVFVPELPSVAAQGKTIADARANAQEAIEGYLEAMHEGGLSIPAVHHDRVTARTEW